MCDLISREQTIDFLGEEPEVWYGDTDEYAAREQWRADVAAIKAVPSAELELEELKAEADKLGYRLVKKTEKVKLLPCSCGYKRKPVEWVKASEENSGWFYKCDNCGKKSEVVNTTIGAKRAWNRMILEEGKGE